MFCCHYPAKIKEKAAENQCKRTDKKDHNHHDEPEEAIRRGLGYGRSLQWLVLALRGEGDGVHTREQAFAVLSGPKPRSD